MRGSQLLYFHWKHLSISFSKIPLHCWYILVFIFHILLSFLGILYCTFKSEILSQGYTVNVCWLGTFPFPSSMEVVIIMGVNLSVHFSSCRKVCIHKTSFSNSLLIQSFIFYLDGRSRLGTVSQLFLSSFFFFFFFCQHFDLL